jgi:hypothetical protein
MLTSQVAFSSFKQIYLTNNNNDILSTTKESETINIQKSNSYWQDLGQRLKNKVIVIGPLLIETV